MILPKTSQDRKILIKRGEVMKMLAPLGLGTKYYLRALIDSGSLESVKPQGSKQTLYLRESALRIISTTN